jgi:hypothetical protein
MLRYSDAVKTLLRASGMTDADIADSELRAEQNLQRFIAAIRRPSVSDEEQRRVALRLLPQGAGTGGTAGQALPA